MMAKGLTNGSKFPIEMNGFTSLDLDDFLDILRQLIREPAVVGSED